MAAHKDTLYEMDSQKEGAGPMEFPREEEDGLFSARDDPAEWQTAMLAYKDGADH